MSALDPREIRRVFAGHADAVQAGPMRRYMQDRFEFFGIKTPQRLHIERPLLAREVRPRFDAVDRLVRGLWSEPERELQYFALDLLESYAKEYAPKTIALIEHLITRKSWWDTVDRIASNIAGPFFRRFPELIESRTRRWMESGDFWLQRSAILFQLNYKEQTNRELLFRYCRMVADSEEFFLRKGIGWALRQYSKCNPAAVVRFVGETKLSPLSKREALKWVERSAGRRPSAARGPGAPAAKVAKTGGRSPAKKAKQSGRTPGTAGTATRAKQGSKKGTRRPVKKKTRR